MYRTPTIPTVFAKSIAQSSGLLEKIEFGETKNHVAIKDAEQRLAYFQQMAIACSYEEARLAYYGCDISEEQETALKLIYESTMPWLIGHVVSELIDTKDKTAKNAEFILTQLIKDGKVDKKVAKNLLVNIKVRSTTDKGEDDEKT